MGKRKSKPKISLVTMKKRMAHWQKRLSLQQWLLRLRLKHTIVTDDGEAAYGWVQWREHVIGADIDVATKDRRAATIEDTVVHELLHIVRLPIHKIVMRMMEYLSPAAKAELSRDYDDAVECMIHVLVQALRPGAQYRAQESRDIK